MAISGAWMSDAWRVATLIVFSEMERIPFVLSVEWNVMQRNKKERGKQRPLELPLDPLRIAVPVARDFSSAMLARRVAYHELR